jgi:hypothetical protein
MEPFLYEAVKESIERGWKSTLLTLLRLLCDTGTRKERRPRDLVYMSATISESLYFCVRNTIPSNFSTINALSGALLMQNYKKNGKTFAN